MGRDGQNDHPFWGRPAGDDRYQPQDPHDGAGDHRRGPSQRGLPVEVATIPFRGTDVQSVEICDSQSCLAAFSQLRLAAP